MKGFNEDPSEVNTKSRFQAYERTGLDICSSSKDLNRPLSSVGAISRVPSGKYRGAGRTGPLAQRCPNLDS